MRSTIGYQSRIRSARLSTFSARERSAISAYRTFPRRSSLEHVPWPRSSPSRTATISATGPPTGLSIFVEAGLAFIPWYPLAAGGLARPNSLLARIAQTHGATPSQTALAWLLQRFPAMLPIPGTSSIAHLEENLASASIRLTSEEFR